MLELLQNPIVQGTIGILGTGLSIYAINNLGTYILKKYYPKILVYILKYAEKLDDNYLDKFKLQYKDLGLEVENQLADTLRKLADIVQDK